MNKGLSLKDTSGQKENHPPKPDPDNDIFNDSPQNHPKIPSNAASPPLSKYTLGPTSPDPRSNPHTTSTDSKIQHDTTDEHTNLSKTVDHVMLQALVNRQTLAKLHEYARYEKTASLGNSELNAWKSLLSDSGRCDAVELVGQSGFASRYRMMMSPCMKYLVVDGYTSSNKDMFQDYTAVLNTGTPVAVVDEPLNDTLTNQVNVSHLKYVSYVPDTSIMVGYCASGDDAEQKYTIKAVYLNNTTLGKESVDSHVFTLEDHDRMFNQNSFGCYLAKSAIQDCSGPGASKDPNTDKAIIGCAFGRTKVSNNADLGKWICTVAFYFAPGNAETISLGHGSIKMNAGIVRLEEFADDVSLTLFLIHGGKELAVFGLLADRIKKGFVIYDLKYKASKPSNKEKVHDLEIFDWKISKRVNLPEEVAYDKDELSAHFDLIDPETTKTRYIPSFTMKKASKLEIYRITFRNYHPYFAIEASTDDIDKFVTIGPHSNIVLGIGPVGNTDIKITLWARKDYTADQQMDYIKMFDFKCGLEDFSLADLDRQQPSSPDVKHSGRLPASNCSTRIADVFLSNDYRNIWVMATTTTDNVNKLIFKQFNLNLLCLPSIKVERYLSHDAHNTQRYLAGDLVEVRADSFNITINDSRARMSQGQYQYSEQIPQTEHTISVIDLFSLYSGGTKSDYELEDITATPSFDTIFVLMRHTQNRKEILVFSLVYNPEEKRYMKGKYARLNTDKVRSDQVASTDKQSKKIVDMKKVKLAGSYLLAEEVFDLEHCLDNKKTDLATAINEELKKHEMVGHIKSGMVDGYLVIYSVEKPKDKEATSKSVLKVLVAGKTQAGQPLLTKSGVKVFELSLDPTWDVTLVNTNFARITASRKLLCLVFYHEIKGILVLTHAIDAKEEVGLTKVRTIRSLCTIKPVVDSTTNTMYYGDHERDLLSLNMEKMMSDTDISVDSMNKKQKNTDICREIQNISRCSAFDIILMNTADFIISDRPPKQRKAIEKDFVDKKKNKKKEIEDAKNNLTKMFKMDSQLHANSGMKQVDGLNLAKRSTTEGFDIGFKTNLYDQWIKKYNLAEDNVKHGTKIAIIRHQKEIGLLTIGVWCLLEKRWIYEFAVQAPKGFLLNKVSNKAKAKSFAFSREAFHLTYLCQDKQLTGKALSKLSIDYDFSPESTLSSSIILPYLVNKYFSCKSEQEKNTTIRTVQVYINLVYPNKLHYVRTMFSLFYSINDDIIFRTLLANINLHSLFYDCRFYEIFFQDSYANECRKCIVQALKDAYVENKDNYIINPSAAREFIGYDNSELMKNEYSRDVFKFLLQCSINETYTFQLYDDKERAFDISNKLYVHQGFVGNLRRLVNRMFKGGDEETKEDGNDINSLTEFNRLKSEMPPDKDADFTTYEVYRSLARINMGSGNNQSTNIFLTISALSDDDIENALAPLIYYKWNRLIYLGTLYSALYWVMAILAYSYFGFFYDNNAYGYVLIALNVGFLIYESKTAISLGFKPYTNDKWNFVDLILLIFSIVVASLCISVVDLNTRPMVYIRIVVVTLLWIRAITWLRVFGPTRYLITMVLQVFIDMIAFMVVFIAAILGYSYIWRLSALLSQSKDGVIPDPPTFYQSFYEPVMLIFGNGPEGEDGDVKFGYIRFGINAIGNIILSFSFLNFLIASISGTFERVEKKKNLYDCKELLNMIIEFDAFLHNMTKKRAPTFFFTLQPEAESDDAKNALKCKIEKLTGKIEVKSDGLEEVVSGKIDRNMQRLDEEIKASFNQLKAVLEKSLGTQNLVENTENVEIIAEKDE